MGSVLSAGAFVAIGVGVVLADLYDTLRAPLRSLAWAAVLVTTSVLLLSADRAG